MDMIDFLEDYEGEPLKLMEVCGTHTASIFKSGIRSILPEGIRLVSGPGCPVCVTPPAFIDACVEISDTPRHTLLSFGDMMKVPGESETLSSAIAMGSEIKMIYSPFEAIDFAEEFPDETFVVAAVGFETTAPAFALLIDEIRSRGLVNIKLLTALKNTVSAIEWICENEPEISGFIAPGHVSVITGADAFVSLSKKYGRPFVVAGFEEEQIVRAIYTLVKLALGTPTGAVVNQYEEVVSGEGNLKAQAKLAEYFEPYDAAWRGLGTIPNSGFRLRPEFAEYDISPELPDHLRKAIDASAAAGMAGEAEGCRCSDIITGRIDPMDCPLFATACTPNNPIGPCMVSSEGACGIWHRNIL
ncbi:MAG: hydrogenase formation protein HypD [Clostridiales Family XIII bacterium]|jgi:hydrogenase expression/formation protein HypD|nr:hydrogenase formation protein HypD [Clostridiales Family XIII bacterium]